MANRNFIGVTLDGPSLHNATDAVQRQGLRAAKNAVTTSARSLELKLEAATRQVRGGDLYRAWGSKVFPERGLARQPSANVYFNGQPGSRTAGAITSIISSGNITSRDGGPIAIPLPAAGSRGKLNNLTPEQWEARTGIKLRPVETRDGRLLLVADQAALSGKRQVAVKNTDRRRARGTGDMTVPIFVVVPQVSFSPLFSVDGIVADEKSRFVAELGDGLRRI